jgi:hypothetical protein
MKRAAILSCFLLQLALISAQDNSGVWRGVMKVVSPFGRDIQFNEIYKLDPITGRPIVPPPATYPNRVIDSSSVHSRAKLEIIQSGDKLMAQMTSYAIDNRQVTMYQFSGGPNLKSGFLLAGKSTLVNETQGTTPPFNLEGKFYDTNGIVVFKGLWRSQLSRTILGTFLFQKMDEPLTINPELVHMFLNPKNDKNLETEETAKLPLSTPVYDSLFTTSFSIDASMIDNGIPDNDTLCIWLNGHVLEDNIVPGKKRFIFRVKLEDKEWNYLTIRCKSEGKIRGAGVLLNMNTDEELLKYNLVLYKYNQVDWVIARKEKQKNAMIK